MLEFLDDPRVSPQGQGFDIKATCAGISGVHVSQDQDEQWRASYIHTGEPINTFGRRDSAEEMVNAVLACDEDSPR